MSDIFDYLKWRGDLTFTQDPPNAVDALIFSALAYIHFSDEPEAFSDAPVLLRSAAEAFFLQAHPEEDIRVKNDLELLRLASESVRFGFAKLYLYRDLLIPEQETQFAAVTFLLDDGSAFVSFRGTDYSLVGWKEDFNMAFQQTVPAQRLAQQYVREVAAEYVGPLRLGGHSKGGNLAVFAAARSAPAVQEQILEVYNNDGPGFTEYMMGDPGYLAMVPRTRTFVPQSSVIGMLLEHEEPYTIIKSKQLGLLQHEIYSWEVMGKSFIPMEEITGGTRFVNATIKDWLAGMTNQERNELVDLMFGLLGTGGVESALDILHPKNVGLYLKTISQDENLRKILSEEFTNLMDAARRTRDRFADKKALET